jgi:protoporphyrinogen oxidase
VDKVKYLILGAGPCGLTIANRLKQMGETSFLLLEKESEVGGLCRSAIVDNKPLDIGGGHFLDVRRPAVNEFLFNFMPLDEWNYFERDSRISFDGMEIEHPFETNIWQMPIEKQIEYLKSIAVAGCNIGQEKPEKFTEWIIWKLGTRIADDYMIPYNRKLFADDLDELGTYWLDKLPNVSFEETLLSCINKKSYGQQPGHASFYYPKEYGYGELWLRMGSAVSDNLITNACVKSIDMKNRVVRFDDRSIQAGMIITTIPWNSFEEIINADERFEKCLSELKSSSVEIRYFPQTLDTKAQWIYYPDDSLPYHRILVRSNFCEGSKGYWTETRKERIRLFNEAPEFSYLNEYAYPINTLRKQDAAKYILDHSRQHQIYGVGRWGEHQHYNSDLVVQRALDLVASLSATR